MAGSSPFTLSLNSANSMKPVRENSYRLVQTPLGNPGSTIEHILHGAGHAKLISWKQNDFYG